MTEFTKPAQEIAEELIKQFSEESGLMCIDAEEGLIDLDAVDRAIKAVSIALQVCSSREWDHDHGEYYTPSRHTKLTEVLQILKSKI